jgi:hypothetical protein
MRFDAADDDIYYTAQGDGVRYWVRIAPLFAGAIGDAMIGGEGNAAKVGFGSKVMLLAAGAITEFFRAIAAAVDLPQPGPAALDREPRRDLAPLASGSLFLGAQSSGWIAGVVEVRVTSTPQFRSVTPESSSPILSDAPLLGSTGSNGEIEDALESARRCLEQLVRQTVKFDEIKIERLASPRIPAGWVRMSLPIRSGAAALLAVDRQSTAALLNCALGADLVNAEANGSLAQTGAEVILMNAIQAFVAGLPGPPDEPRHTARLTDEAILADLPHRSIEHRFTAGRHSGALHWLIPDTALQSRVIAAGAGRFAGAQ